MNSIPQQRHILLVDGAPQHPLGAESGEAPAALTLGVEHHEQNAGGPLRAEHRESAAARSMMRVNAASSRAANSGIDAATPAASTVHPEGPNDDASTSAPSTILCTSTATYNLGSCGSPPR
ncbi:hypothetical protein JM654_08410 [Microbacterium oxydans]|nr:hypothetical protein [Microbacterium oxydans]